MLENSTRAKVIGTAVAVGLVLFYFNSRRKPDTPENVKEKNVYPLGFAGKGNKHRRNDSLDLARQKLNEVRATDRHGDLEPVSLTEGQLQAVKVLENVSWPIEQFAKFFSRWF